MGQSRGLKNPLAGEEDVFLDLFLVHPQKDLNSLILLVHLWLLVHSSRSHLIALPISVLWAGLKKSKQLNLDARNIFVGSQTPRAGGVALTSQAEMLKTGTRLG